jgi:methionyl-tRNA formyltransferase
MISALKVEDGIDTGPVYLKKPLTLSGTAQGIFLRAGLIIVKMMQEIIAKRLEPVTQKGKVVIFKRRTPEQSNLQNVRDMKIVYDLIRMLDADGYPKAFIETDLLRFEFSNASLKNNSVTANVKIIKK